MNLTHMSRQQLMDSLAEKYNKQQLEKLTTDQLRQKLAVDMVMRPFSFF